MARPDQRSGERFASLNPAATTLYGADDPCLLDGTPIMDRIHADFHEEAATRLQQMAGGEKAHDDSSQQLHLTCDGSHVWVDVVCSPIHYEGKESVLLFIRDITGHIEHEKQIRSNLREKEVMLAEIDFQSYITELADFVQGYFSRRRPWSSSGPGGRRRWAWN